MAVTPYARRQAYGTDYSTSGVEKRRPSRDRRANKDRRTGKDRRQVYDADYFANGGVERRRGSWERRSSRDRRFAKYRRLTFDPKYMFVPERQSGQDQRGRADRKIRERRSGMGRSRTHTESRLLSDLNRLEHTLERLKV